MGSLFFFALKARVGLSRWLSGKESTCQCRICGWDPWVGKIPWRKKWQSTPVSLPGKSHGQRSLGGYSPWDQKDLDKTEQLAFSLSLRIYHYPWGFPGGATGKEPTCQRRRHRRRGFSPWVGKTPWRRAWQPTPVFLPGKSHGQRSRAGYSPWGHKELDTTEADVKLSIVTL